MMKRIDKKYLNAAAFSLVICAAALLCFVLKGTKYLLLVLLAAAIHESGHILTARLLGVRRIRERERFSFSLRFDFSACSFLCEAAVCFAGAFFNIVSCVVCALVFGLRGYAPLFFVFSSTALAAFNLMPISPLDGFGVISALLCEVFSDETVYKITRTLSRLFSFAFFLLTVYIQLRVGANLSLIIISALLLLNCFREKY